MVALRDGRQVRNDSEEFRRECELIHFCRLFDPMSQSEYAEYLAALTKKRDKGRVDDLLQGVEHIEPYYVLELPTIELRRAYLGRVEARRGPSARNALERSVRRLWESRRQGGTA